MPNYKTHLVGGAAAFGITLLATTQLMNVHPTLVTGVEWFIAALAGSLFPDIDVKSKGQKYFYWVVLGVFLFFIMNHQYEMLAGCSVIAVLPMLVKHRGIFHRLWFIILAPFALWFFVSSQVPHIQYRLLYDTLFFVAGAISHLWLDLGFRGMIRL